jgi:WhiB family redox-sensing transcriptional regulator
MPEHGLAPSPSSLVSQFLAAGGADEPTAQVRLSDALAVWTDALCAQVDPELFFPELGEPATGAKAVCAACPARVRCLDVFGDLPHGVVGGLSAYERRARRAARRAGAAA